MVFAQPLSWLPDRLSITLQVMSLPQPSMYHCWHGRLGDHDRATQASRRRGRRRLSQLELALESGISARHLSFVENGKSFPSRDTILRLAEQLDLPLRERNHLLLAAGYAPVYSEATLGSPRCPPCAGR